MPQALFETKQDRFLVIGFDVNDPVGMESGCGQRGREKITRAQAPEHRTIQTCENARGEQHSRAAEHRPKAATGEFVQGAESQTTARKATINRRQAERQHRPRRPIAPLDAGNLGAQFLEDAGFGRHGNST